ncbi:sugar-binding protein [Membranihabitans marinus]|uniref:sugar-binding protein n=1 Tax=Membranihabitans marinus TaxID=1227546 RepID=UPI001F456411|nr:sugar-binding protein [Membranihabitans marinus]
MNLSCQSIPDNQYLIRQIDPTTTDDWVSMDWTKGDELSEFKSPWTNNQNNGTSFVAVHDGQYFYFKYRVTDDNVLLYTDQNTRFDVLNSDRIEIFFRKNVEMDPYYCLEMDPLGRIYDYKAKLYRIMDTDWRWPKDQLQVEATMLDDGYIFKGRISLSSLTDLGLINENIIEAGLYRGKCLSIEGDKAEFEWITWIDPNVDKADFHIASSFGTLLLENY